MKARYVRKNYHLGWKLAMVTGFSAIYQRRHYEPLSQ
jgi:hypothetical protein